MKRATLAILALFSCASLAAQTVSLERGLATAVDSLAAELLAGRSSTLKAVVALGTFEASGPTAKSLEMDRVARDALAATLSRSTVLVVVERANLAAVLEELELQLSGLTDESTAVELGRMLNAEAIVYGSVTERADDFVVTITMTVLESARASTREFAVARSDFVADAERRLDMLYVSPMGIGIAIRGLDTIACGDDASPAPFDLPGTTFLRRNVGAELRYRVTDWFMLGFGIDWLYGVVWRTDALSWDLTGIGGSSGTGPFAVEAKGIGLPITAWLSWNPVRWLSLQFSFSAEYCILDFSGYFEPSVGNGFGLNDFGPLLSAEFFAFSAEAGFELFVTPRASIGLSLGWSFGGTELATDPLWHLKGGANPLPGSLPVYLEGFSYGLAVAFYF